MVQRGTYAELLSTSSAFAHLLEDINQHEHEQEQEQNTIVKRQSCIGSTHSEADEQEDAKALPTNIEIKQEGTVKWFVFISYLRAGIGIALGVILLVTVFCAQQSISLLCNWWVAEWSNDESHRHRIDLNCTNLKDLNTIKIRAMDETEWNEHRNKRFYKFCGK